MVQGRCASCTQLVQDVCRSQLPDHSLKSDEEVLKDAQVHGLDEVQVDAGPQGAPIVLLRAQTGNGDKKGRLLTAPLAHSASKLESETVYMMKQ